MNQDEKDVLAANLDRAVKANPMLLHHPDLAWTVAQGGGNVEENALEIYGVYLKRLAGIVAVNAMNHFNEQHVTNMAFAKDPSTAHLIHGGPPAATDG